MAVKAFLIYCTITIVITNLAVSIGKLLTSFITVPLFEVQSSKLRFLKFDSQGFKFLNALENIHNIKLKVRCVIQCDSLLLHTVYLQSTFPAGILGNKLVSKFNSGVSKLPIRILR